jgi:uncharacterized protein HemY
VVAAADGSTSTSWESIKISCSLVNMLIFCIILFVVIYGLM